MKKSLRQFLKMVSMAAFVITVLFGLPAILGFSIGKNIDGYPKSVIKGNFDKRAEVNLTVLNSMERIEENQTSFGELQATVKGARNEVVSFQLIVSAVENNIHVNKMEVSDLTRNKDIIGKENISLFREEYARVRQSFPRAKLPPGLYTDPLVPFIDAKTGAGIEVYNTHLAEGDEVVKRGFHMYGIPFDVWKGKNQPIWVDVSIPKNAAAGKYEGIVTVYLNDALTFGKTNKGNVLNKVVSIPVTLTVWNFTLPDISSLRNHFGGVEGVARAFKADVNSERYKEIEMEYCKMMAANRINPPLPKSFLPEMREDGSLKISPESNQALKNFMKNFHIRDFAIPMPLIKEPATTNRDKAIRYFKDYYEFVKENGWENSAYVYLFDEPNSKESYEKVSKLGALVHAAAPQLRCLVTEQPYQQNSSWPNIDSAVDIWCPLWSYIDRDAINEKLAKGDEVWSYTAVGQRAPSYHPNYNQVKDFDPPYWQIDEPLSSYRVSTWINWQYKITGLLYWSTVYNSNTITGVVDPWALPVYFSEDGYTYGGEGYLMYPGTPCGIDGPIASIRLKNIRDAMEDYEYFVILEKLAGRDAVTKIVSEEAPDWWAVSYDPKILLSARERIANEIMKFQK
jgi:hypothetical protein